ncbi:hypothetical protein NDS46_31650 (plasmid) [Paenibacillus thiaminolyticus]|uniref:hypothetical protein n=1 Tax=Paenibacillus thiaminolyticus TaxID=49283 RepID=UPI00232F8D81|nr:hypothetical protein [Paenibacillus thiaminolyticus]WCF11514.1 hypothetical protein NDS46_31650 [Paenibacillus thiaminolyticus]
MVKKSWKSLNEVYFEGKTLVHAGYGNDKNKGNHKISQFYVDKVDICETPNHYSVTWDFEDFYQSEKNGTFEWPFPHAMSGVEENEKENVVRYFSSTAFSPFNKTIESHGIALTILNRPVEFAPMAGALRYYAGAMDQHGNVYKVYWNMFNIFQPTKIEMTVDNRG